MKTKIDLKQMALLDLLKDKELRFGELEKSVKLSKATLRIHLAKLEKMGLVERIWVETDGYPRYRQTAKAKSESEYFDMELFSFNVCTLLLDNVKIPPAGLVALLKTPKELRKYIRQLNSYLKKEYKHLLLFCALMELKTEQPWIQAMQHINNHMKWCEEAAYSNDLPKFLENLIPKKKFKAFMSIYDDINSYKYTDRVDWAETLQIRCKYKPPVNILEDILNNVTITEDYIANCVNAEYNYLMDYNINPAKFYSRLRKIEYREEIPEKTLKWLYPETIDRWYELLPKLQLPP